MKKKKPQHCVLMLENILGGVRGLATTLRPQQKKGTSKLKPLGKETDINVHTEDGEWL